MAPRAINEDHQERLNSEIWAGDQFVDFYAVDGLRAVESLLLERYRGALSGRVLELGCGAGRLTRHLCELATRMEGVDVSAAMVAHCQQVCPRAEIKVGDLRELRGFETSVYSAIVAPYNVLDVLGQQERSRVLAELRRMLKPGALLIMSSHNRACSPGAISSIRTLVGSPRRPLMSLAGLPRRLRNRRRIGALERSEEEYELRNDEAHDFTLLHYYISRDAQVRQLREHGYEPLECLDLDGQIVSPGSQAPLCAELHYVAVSP